MGVIEALTRDWADGDGPDSISQHFTGDEGEDHVHTTYDISHIRRFKMTLLDYVL